ncbi:hypothetical protein C5167_019971 [Papaver somniferum]|uniref:Uncharacterized protein n=1 Tax=Papaver somniferum TaxID=3469 RepID=A0A4Y7IVM5_PAPSO|nr:hypothetical protein C5167_019971 [Papaver somniferum]
MRVPFNVVNNMGRVIPGNCVSSSQLPSAGDKHLKRPNITDLRPSQNSRNQDEENLAESITSWDFMEKSTSHASVGEKISHPRKRDADRNDDVSESSILNSVSSLDISPDDVVGVIGQKHLWKARKAIAKSLIFERGENLKNEDVNQFLNPVKGYYQKKENYHEKSNRFLSDVVLVCTVSTQPARHLLFPSVVDLQACG